MRDPNNDEVTDWGREFKYCDGGQDPVCGCSCHRQAKTPAVS